jgi:hypothetical protein
VKRSQVCVAAALATATLVFWVSPATAGFITGGLSPDLANRVVSPLGQARPTTGGTFDIHAAAEVQGAVGGALNVKHIPSQPAALNNFFPVGFSQRQFKGYFGTLRGPDFQGPVTKPLDPTASGLPAYSTAAKDFGRVIPFTTPNAFRTAVNPANGRRTSAEAVASIRFSLGPAGETLMSPEGSFARLDSQNDFRTQQFGPDGRAAYLVRDPIHYTGVQRGDLVQGTISLSAADFLVQINEEESGLFSSTLEMGTNLFGPSSGPLGLSSDGNPLLFRLDTLFLPNGAEGFAFDFDSSLMGRGLLTFLDPENGNRPITGDVEGFVTSRLAGALDFNSSDGTWHLTRNVQLFTYQLTATEATNDLQIDYLDAGLAATAVPEPSTFALFGIGTISLLGLARRWQRTSDKTNA